MADELTDAEVDALLERYDQTEPALQRRIVARLAAELVEERDALAAFKKWVHDYLDAKGIPTHPDGPHGREGCRIGDRMDLVFAELDALRAVARQVATFACCCGLLARLGGTPPCLSCRARACVGEQPKPSPVEEKDA